MGVITRYIAEHISRHARRPDKISVFALCQAARTAWQALRIALRDLEEQYRTAIARAPAGIHLKGFPSRDAQVIADSFVALNMPLGLAPLSGVLSLRTLLISSYLITHELLVKRLEYETKLAEGKDRIASLDTTMVASTNELALEAAKAVVAESLAETLAAAFGEVELIQVRPSAS